MERRQNHRIAVDLPAELMIAGGHPAQAAELVNVSLRGALVTCAIPRRLVGASCVLTVFAEGGTLDVITVRARIANASATSCGLRFDAMDRSDFALLHHLMRRRTTAPARLRDELRTGAIPAVADWSVADGVAASRAV